MSCNNYYRAKLKLESSKNRWLKVNPDLPNRSGIYILTRVDEQGFKYAYIGQAKHILERLAQHLMQYQHIDLSLKKHKLFNEIKNPYGWQVDYFECLEEELNKYEQEYILHYANLGYQLRNKTSGSQGQGKVGIDDNKASKGYYDGIAQGKKNAYGEIKEFFDKYLDYSIKPNLVKKNGEFTEIAKRKFNEFKELLNERKDNNTVSSQDD